MTATESSRRWVELFSGTNGKWYFHVKAANGEVTSASQGYANRKGARKAIRRDWPGLEVRVIRERA